MFHQRENNTIVCRHATRFLLWDNLSRSSSMVSVCLILLLLCITFQSRFSIVFFAFFIPVLESRIKGDRKHTSWFSDALSPPSISSPLRILFVCDQWIWTPLLSLPSSLLLLLLLLDLNLNFVNGDFPFYESATDSHSVKSVLRPQAESSTVDKLECIQAWLQSNSLQDSRLETGMFGQAWRR
jgi:hypothetical protein